MFEPGWLRRDIDRAAKELRENPPRLNSGWLWNELELARRELEQLPEWMRDQARWAGKQES